MNAYPAELYLPPFSTDYHCLGVGVIIRVYALLQTSVIDRWYNY